jgi:phage shock protein A
MKQPKHVFVLQRALNAEAGLLKQTKKLVEQYVENGKLETAYNKLLAENARLRQRARGWCIAWAVAILFLVIITIGGVLK